MARPRKESLDYFPHDTDAANDEKIYAMRSLFGNDGYVFYFILLERIYRTSTAELDVSKPVLLASVTHQVGVAVERFNEMLQSSFDIDLFDKAAYEDRKVITSRAVKKRFREVERMREKWRSRKAENETDSTPLPTEFSPEKTPQETKGKTPQSKAKQIESKTLYGDHVQMMEGQYQKLISDFGQDVTDDYIDRINYWFTQKPEKKKGYSNHYMMVRQWKARDEKRRAEHPSNQEAEAQQRLADQRKNAEEMQFEPDPILQAVL